MTPLNKANPFSTRFTRPDAVEFLFRSSDASALDLAKKFAADGSIAQIVGAHGSGKTTLTFAIERELKALLFEAHPINTRRITIREHGSVEAVTTHPFLGMSEVPGKRLLIIDGIERLSLVKRLILISHCKSAKIGLLITTHRRLSGVPVLYKTTPTLATLERLVKQLAPDSDIGTTLLTTVFEKTKMNIRESLMLLYDEFV